MSQKQLTMDEEILHFLKGITRRRMSRVVMYGLLTCAAVVSGLVPSAVLVGQSNETLAIVWSFSFGIAAFACFIGSILDRWIAEYSMIPMLATTLLVFGLAMIGESQGPIGWRIIPYAFLFSAFSLGLVARWRDVQSLLRVATHMEEK